MSLRRAAVNIEGARGDPWMLPRAHRAATSLHLRARKSSRRCLCTLDFFLYRTFVCENTCRTNSVSWTAARELANFASETNVSISAEHLSDKIQLI